MPTVTNDPLKPAQLNLSKPVKKPAKKKAAKKKASGKKTSKPKAKSLKIRRR